MPLTVESLQIVQPILQNLELLYNLLIRKVANKLLIIHYNAVFLFFSVNFGLKM